MTDLTTNERAKLEALLAEYANAEMDCVRASGRRHDALHRVLDYVNTRTALADSGAFGAVPPAPCVPTGTQTFHADCTRPFTKEELANSPLHVAGPWVPVPECACATCCTARALAGIGKSSTLLPLGEDELPHPHGPLDPSQR